MVFVQCLERWRQYGDKLTPDFPHVFQRWQMFRWQINSDLRTENWGKIHLDVSKNRGFYPQNGWFIMENPIKIRMIWGYPYFWKYLCIPGSPATAWISNVTWWDIHLLSTDSELQGTKKLLFGPPFVLHCTNVNKMKIQTIAMAVLACKQPFFLSGQVLICGHLIRGLRGPSREWGKDQTGGFESPEKWWMRRVMTCVGIVCCDCWGMEC